MADGFEVRGATLEASILLRLARLDALQLDESRPAPVGAKGARCRSALLSAARIPETPNREAGRSSHQCVDPLAICPQSKWDSSNIEEDGSEIHAAVVSQLPGLDRLDPRGGRILNYADSRWTGRAARNPLENIVRVSLQGMRPIVNLPPIPGATLPM